MSKTSQEDSFMNVMFQEEVPDGENVTKGHDSFYRKFVENASGQYSDPAITGAHALRKLYPGHSLVMTTGSVTGLPGVNFIPLSPSEMVTNVQFVPLALRSGMGPGVLVDQIKFAGLAANWEGHDFIIYTAQWQIGFSYNTQHWILHEGPETNSRNLVLTAGAWREALHDEIWQFDGGQWEKNHALWVEVQKADWKDVILKEEFKKNLKKDVYGFFASEDVYKELAIPWKRGLIMHGPPGNGKTISIKAIMKSSSDSGFKPLYVKSFQSWKGEEGAMADVFNKARQLSPCVVIIEDLDSLITDKNRSFFLNQLDGLEGNDGLLIIGTTNHFERLDPGLSTRPSRFDRKFLFDDPDLEERALYCKYWQNKLKSNKNVSYPDELVDDIAKSTEQFSFAYLKEIFVSSLVLLAGLDDDEKPEFETLVKVQIKTLRKQLDKMPKAPAASSLHAWAATPAPPEKQQQTYGLRALLSGMSVADAGPSKKIYTTANPEGGAAPSPARDSEFQRILNGLSRTVGAGSASHKTFA
ncbi:P-loop containing nucleoside triphosphate hydrolase protein [Athelia psychrophila]|uniref:P-loop containing nucleoside triphosphate hydrolase protein n=1 Tax=Athelia psychrophila TaxID=1759441 RepID=A0A166HFR4_9AGAM|nr:P-loop containing nucleoside triphosphate hydrolase protein [Fibularhizoctonia sp. CBS 109695]